MCTNPSLWSGVAAAVLPDVFLRGLLGKLLRTSPDVDALGLDYFPEIKRRFSEGMERVQRESLLLEHAAPHPLYRALRAICGEAEGSTQARRSRDQAGYLKAPSAARRPRGS